MSRPSKISEEVIAFKVLLIGPSGVGKTSLLSKYIHNKFTYDYSVTTGVQFYTKSVQVNERSSINLQMWDTMGQQAYKSIVKSHYKGVSAILLLYSIDKHETYDKLGMWLRQIKDNTHEETVIFLVATKLDLQQVRKVSREEGQVYSNNINAVGFIEISSKTGQNIKELFDKLSKTLYKKYNSSKSFKELVKPITVANSFAKTQSFRLNKNNFVGGQFNTPEKSKPCCS